MHFKCFLIVVASFLLSACSSISMLFSGYQGNHLHSLSFDSSTELPHDIPLTIDIVFLNSAEAQQVIQNMTNEQWFTSKTVIQARLGGQVLIKSIELVPGLVNRTMNIEDTYRSAHQVIVIPRFGKKMTIPKSFKHPVLSFTEQGLLSIDEHD